MSFFKHISGVKKSLGESISHGLAVGERTTSAAVAADAALIVRDRSNKAMAIKRHGFDDASIDWSFVSRIVYAIDERKCGMNRHEARKLNALRQTADARRLIGSESQRVIPLLKSAGRDGLTRAAFEAGINGDNHRTFATMLAKAGLCERKWQGRGWSHISVNYQGVENMAFWNALYSLCD